MSALTETCIDGCNRSVSASYYICNFEHVSNVTFLNGRVKGSSTFNWRENNWIGEMNRSLFIV